jgi:hypothetical protein
MKQLPQTGTSALLEVLPHYLDDGFINDLCPTPKGCTSFASDWI